MNWFKRGKKAPAIQSQTSPGQHQQKCDWQWPIVEAINRISDQIEASTKEEKTEDTSGARREIITIGLVFATFVAALVGDVIFFVNLQDSRRAIKIQHQDTQVTLIESERAWIAPELITYLKPIQEGSSFTINVSYQNVGKEPALDERTLIKVDVFDVSTLEAYSKDNFDFVTTNPNELEAICDQGVNAVTGTVMYPDNSVAENWPGTPSEPYEYSDIISGKSLVIMHGCFRYNTFATVHYSIFCRVLAWEKDNSPASWQWRDCASGNYAD